MWKIRPLLSMMSSTNIGHDILMRQKPKHPQQLYLCDTITNKQKPPHTKKETIKKYRRRLKRSVKSDFELGKRLDYLNLVILD